MQMLIKGEWRGAQHGQIEVCHLFDKRVIDTVPQATAAVDAARIMEKTPVHVRMQALRLAADKMDNETEASAKIISDESGKPIVEARGEAVRMGEMLRLAAYEGGHLRGETLSLDALAIPSAEDKMGFTFRVPCGVEETKRSAMSNEGEAQRDADWVDEAVTKEGIGKTVREMTEVKNAVIHGVER
ncbi:MAG: aldehyde dehydrogenase family protein [Arenicellales bacterium WSBS_2016_MAG_OTU3]